jgi:hypothetical protein
MVSSRAKICSAQRSTTFLSVKARYDWPRGSQAMVVPAFVLLFAPLTLVGIGCCLSAAWREWLGAGGAPGRVRLARWLMFALPLVGAAVALLERLDRPDWQRLYWAAQFPLLAAFFLSGTVLSRLWRDPSETAATERRAGGAAAFLAICAGLALLPLALQLAIPDPDPPPRATGAPLARLSEIARWSFGGPAPESLRPEPTDTVRSIAHLPRELTVPLGIALAAAWLWIAFCVLAFAGRLVRSPRVRRALLLALPALTAPLFLQDLVHRREDDAFGWNLLWPLSAEHAAVWRSAPAVLATFGPVLLVAVLAAAVLFAALAVDHARRRAS